MAPRTVALAVVASIMVVYALVSVRQMVLNTLQSKGASDFHSYWYAALFVGQGKDPYAAFIAGDAPSLPVYHIDGSVTHSFEALPTTPANTAVTVLLVSPLSLYKWETAKIAWLAINLVAAVATPIIALRLFPAWVPRWLTITSIPAYLALGGTRQAIGNGQTTVVVILRMLLSLLQFKRGRQALSGLLLGLALGKYSLSLPLAIFYLWRRQWAILLAATATQMGGFMLLAALTGSSPFSAMSAYYQVARRHLGHPGVHLSAAISSNTTPGLELVATGVSLGATCLVVRHFLQHWPDTATSRNSRAVLDQQEWAVLSAFSAWALAGVYHSFYDTGLLLVPILFLTGGAVASTKPELNPKARRLVVLGLLLCVGYLAHPGSVIRLHLSQWDTISARLSTTVIVGLFAATVWQARQQAAWARRAAQQGDCGAGCSGAPV